MSDFRKRLIFELKILQVLFIVYLSLNLILSSEACAQTPENQQPVFDLQALGVEPKDLQIQTIVIEELNKPAKIALPKGDSTVMVMFSHNLKLHFPDLNIIELDLVVTTKQETVIYEICNKPNIVKCQRPIHLPKEEIYDKIGWKLIYGYPWEKTYWVLFRINSTQESEYLFTLKGNSY